MLMLPLRSFPGHVNCVLFSHLTGSPNRSGDWSLMVSETFTDVSVGMQVTSHKNSEALDYCMLYIIRVCKRGEVIAQSLLLFCLVFFYLPIDAAILSLYEMQEVHRSTIRIAV